MQASSASASPESAELANRSWLRRHRRSLLIAVLGLIVVVVAVGAAASWYFSSEVLVPERSGWPLDATVEGLSPGRVVLSRSEDTLRPGVYGLLWQGGNAILGEVVKSDAETVTRRLAAVHGYYLRPGMKVALDTDVYAGNPRQTLGLPFTNVLVPDELGPMPAWLIPGRTHTWAIIVHGINGDQQAGLRIAPTLHRDGLPAMLITYREDLGAPPSPDGSAPHRPHRVARPAGGGPLRALPRRPSPRPDRLLDGRCDRRPVHGALAARASGRRPRPRRPGS